MGGRQYKILGKCASGDTLRFLRRPMLSAIGVLFIVLSACTVGPNYSRPAAPTALKYKEENGPTRSIDHVITAKWWEVFADPELNALEEQVDISNQNIVRAEARFRQARALVEAARAAYFPVVTVGIGVTRTQQSPTAEPGPAKTTGAFTQHSLPRSEE